MVAVRDVAILQRATSGFAEILMRDRSSVVVVLTLLLAAGAAVADVAPNGITLPGTAITGGDTRVVELALNCIPDRGSGSLNIELHVPHFETLQSQFDFDPLEGPGANAGDKTRIGVSEQNAERSSATAVAGWIGVTDDVPFDLGLYLPGAVKPAVVRHVRDTLSGILATGGQLVWIQENVKKGGPALVATFPISADIAQRLRQRLSLCLVRK